MLKRILGLLLPEEKKKGVSVSAAVFLTACLDFAGLAALLPILYYLLDGEPGQRTNALLFCLAAFLFIILKNGLVAWLYRYRTSFLLSLYRRLSLSLFSSYYHKGLLFIRSRGSVRLGHDVNFVCYSFALNILSPLLSMTGEALLILLITVALLIYNPLTVLLLYAVFIPFFAAYAGVVRRRIREWGSQELHTRREQTRLVTESLKGYPELELNSAFPFLRASVEEGLMKVSGNRLRMETLGRIPLLITEMAVVVGLTLLTAFGSGDLKTLVGVFALASFRLLPAIRNIIGCWAAMQNSSHCLDIIQDGLSAETKEKDKAVAALPFNEEIRIENLCFSYPDGEPVLQDFSCVVRKGEHVGIRGESGIGKTTLFCLLLGFLKPTDGRILIDGVLLDDNSLQAWQKRLGYVAQEVFVADCSLAENIALGLGEVDRAKIEQLLRQVGLDSWVQTLPDGIDTVMSESGGRLSGGQKQRLGIARALYKDADVLLLDEATSALDNATEQAINEMLRTLAAERGSLTILTIAHRESTLSYCGRVVTLS